VTYEPGEYYWLCVNGKWEICQCAEAPGFPLGVVFEIIGVDGNVYTIDNISMAIHVPFPFPEVRETVGG
jgi:hypothetical protein